jgi:hypothetical protein
MIPEIAEHRRYLESIEQAAMQHDMGNFYLWPRTPIETIQDKIRQRVGATDYETDKQFSRPALIVQFLQRLLEKNLIPGNFSVLDIACGDAVVLWQIKKNFPASDCYGIDCNKGRFSSHAQVEKAGVRLYAGFIQHLFKADAPAPFDMVLMLNTYRDWKAADLREHERELPDLAHRWFEANAKYIVLTVAHDGFATLKKLGFALVKIGKGEDRSTLVCISKLRMPAGPLGAWWEGLKRWE